MHATHTSHIKHVEIVTCVSFTWGLLIETPIASWKIRGCKAVYSRTCVSFLIRLLLEYHDMMIVCYPVRLFVELNWLILSFSSVYVHPPHMHPNRSSPSFSHESRSLILEHQYHRQYQYTKLSASGKSLSSNHLGYTSVASEKFSAFRFPLAFHCFNWSVWRHGLWY